MRRYPVRPPILRTAALTLSGILLLTVSACGDDDPAAPTGSIAGTYTSTSFRVDDDNLLAQGAFLTLTLDPVSTVSGRLIVPMGGEEPVDADMEGTYELDGNTVTFTQQADTFVRDATWTWLGDFLDGIWSNGEVTVTVRLTRQ